MSAVNWKGVFPAMLSPFTQEDKIDFDIYRKNLLEQIDAGVSGIVLCGSLGEASTLSNEEKRDLLIYSKELTADHIPVIVNIAEQSTHLALASVKDAEKNGADGLMLLPPMRYKADERETLEYFRILIQSTSLPIMLYNNPFDYKIEVSIDMFEKLVKYDNVQAVKESTRDVTNVTRMKNRFGNRLKILCGVDTLALEELASGADGWIAGLVDAFPRETVAIYNLMVAGYYGEARKIYRWFMPLLELDIHSKLVQYIKLAATKTGIGTEYVRAPRLVLEGAERQSLLDTIEKALKTRPLLPNYLQLQPLSTVEW